MTFLYYYENSASWWAFKEACSQVAGGTNAVSFLAIIILWKKLWESHPWLPCDGAREDNASLITVLRFPAWDPGKQVQELGVAVTETQKYGGRAISPEELDMNK